jgi:hypothetical protein
MMRRHPRGARSTPSINRGMKPGFLIAGGWVLEKSALKWGADQIRHHAACDQITQSGQLKLRCEIRRWYPTVIPSRSWEERAGETVDVVQYVIPSPRSHSTPESNVIKDEGGQ